MVPTFMASLSMLALVELSPSEEEEEEDPALDTVASIWREGGRERGREGEREEGKGGREGEREGGRE